MIVRRLYMRYILILFICLINTEIKAQYITGKTNMLWLGGTFPNGGVEFALNKKWTIDAWGIVNAWDYPNNMQLNVYLFQPEVRYWLCQKFEGHFFGAHGHVGHYNIGMIPWIKKMEHKVYRGNLYGSGISYGYHYPFGKRWGLEFTIGVGYVFLDYEEFYCINCAESRGKKNKHYLGPTRAGISLIYFIK